MAAISSAYSFSTTLRFTFSDGVSSPLASVKSRGQDPEHLDRLGLGHRLVGVVDGGLDLGRAGPSSSRRSATRRVRRLAVPAFQAGSASSSMVTSAAMNGCRSPTTMHWLTSGWARIRSSSTAGATFLPPAVTMSSFLRPVMRRIAVVVELAEVAGVEPAVGVERLGGGLLVVPVAGEDDVARDQDLAVVGDPDGHAGQRPADRADPDARPAG